MTRGVKEQESAVHESGKSNEGQTQQSSVLLEFLKREGEKKKGDSEEKAL